MSNPFGSLLDGRHDSAREIALDGYVPLLQKCMHGPIGQECVAVAYGRFSMMKVEYVVGDQPLIAVPSQSRMKQSTYPQST